MRDTAKAVEEQRNKDLQALKKHHESELAAAAAEADKKIEEVKRTMESKMEAATKEVKDHCTAQVSD